eukprot:Trichotokara_eunicae@DN6576_c0_g1_i1.p1
MLVVDPSKRITLKEVQRHPWYRTDLPMYLAVAASTSTSHLVVEFNPEVVTEMQNLGYDTDYLSSEEVVVADGRGEGDRWRIATRKKKKKKKKKKKYSALI